MTKKYPLIVFFLLFSVFLYSQENEQVKFLYTAPNGVRVYESTGVQSEKKVLKTTEVKTRTVSEWSLDDCNNALYYIDLKINEVKDNPEATDQLKAYQEKVTEILKRKQELTSK